VAAEASGKPIDLARGFACMDSPSLHSYAMNGYHIDGSTIRFALDGQTRSAEPHRAVELVFRDVEGYLFERKTGGDTVLTVEEHPLIAFLRANEEYFAREARWGWPRFWQGSADQTEGWLAYRGRRVWTVSTSYGLAGWVVAGSAGYHNAANQAPLGAVPPLAAWRLPSPKWRP
jgi:hypothetical protein